MYHIESFEINVSMRVSIYIYIYIYMIAYRHLCILCFFMHIHTVYARQMSSNPKNTCETQSMAVNSRRYKPGTCSKDLPVLDSKEVQSIAPPSCPDDCNHRGRWVAVGG